MARYREIAQDLRDRLAAGEFHPGDRLPSIADLQEHYDVAGLNTIRQAQQLLVEEGLIETRQGSGAFVLRTVPEASPVAAASAATQLDEHVAWATLAAAGISVDDVEVVVARRARSARATALSMVDIVANATTALAAGAGAEVPDGHRYGRGARLTDTDLIGAYRTLAAAAEHWRRAAAKDDTEYLRAMTLRAMARRAANGEHNANMNLVAVARSVIGATSPSS